MNAKHTFPFRHVAIGVLLMTIGIVTIVIGYGTWISGLMVGAGLYPVYPVYRWVRRYHSTASTLARRRTISAKGGGVITRRQHFSTVSAPKIREMAPILRPDTYGDLAGKHPRKVAKRQRIPIESLAFKVGDEARLGAVYSPSEQVTIRLGGPRKGKTAELACHALTAPGACIVTSTRRDIYDATWRLREQKNSTTYVFDPSGSSGLANSLKFSVMSGCKHPATALRRAAAMVPVGADEAGQRWDLYAQRTLAVLLHAAALIDGSLVDVLRWASLPDDKYLTEVKLALRNTTSTTRAQWMNMADQFFSNNENTRSSITTTLLKQLNWVLDDAASEAGQAADSDSFDVDRMLREKDTIYMIVPNDGMSSSLVAALVDEVAHRAQVLAKHNGGRLDPHLTLVLDEAATTCPLPLPEWTAHFGGFGITIHISAQNPSQLAMVWGHLGAQSIMDNGMLIVFGGVKDIVYLRAWSELAGDNDVPVLDSSGNKTGESRVERILTPRQIFDVPAGRALVFRDGLGACLVKTVNIWKRKDVRKNVDPGVIRATPPPADEADPYDPFITELDKEV